MIATHIFVLSASHSFSFEFGMKLVPIQGYILPRDVMLAQCMLWPCVCPSVSASDLYRILVSGGCAAATGGCIINVRLVILCRQVRVATVPNAG